MNTLYVYGDSWPFGAGLADYNQAFPNLMENILINVVAEKKLEAIKKIAFI
jgi:hypothetical protein